MTDQVNPQCPVNEPSCPIIDEVLTLRHEVQGLQKQVRTDSLTGLYNFRHFSDVLEQEMERTRRSQQATALIMVDLDHFKKVNDNWGHEAGNQALISTAQILSKTTRQLDTPCRYGGEEFGVILPSIDLVTALQVAERIRETIALIPVMVDGQDIGLTASLGVALYEAKQGAISAQQFVERADRCLYQAKEQGRNQVAHEVLERKPELSVSLAEKEALSNMFGDHRE
ncbi:GGDEF domain-containing protein [Dasania sp. GY-MA-18]|uniref:diguanylate cyclase n=1 Tax=Dasania phycosphaerae TaxID=2950436 RepID=A0A9J6RKT4_9GAMM|nr:MULTISPECIES: GGDEF domain-containing protein [Dasania]MCR8922581.1 GGDEF domain-containing protein [Dasania sp. GY-MA-18]MCZ0865010.1 GGDEF domain-containing protein [Dasania phycosphaerae]MCZ0868737.1 GGDEF domain-containing protein [Dasania phycosphaerae]